jgi:hypothetical protein
VPSVELVERFVLVWTSFTQRNDVILHHFLRAIQDFGFKLVIELANAIEGSVHVPVSTGNEPVEFFSFPAEVCLKEEISLLLKF